MTPTQTRTRFQDSETGLWGYKDENGIVKIPAKYDRAYEFQKGGTAKVQTKNKVGFIKPTGQVVAPFKPNIVEHLGHYCSSYEYLGKLGLCNNNSILTEPIYERIGNSIDNLIVVVKDGLVGVVNIKGGVVIPCIYSHITPYTEGLCVVTLNSGNKQFFNNKGKPIGKEWEDLGRMLDGRAWVKVGDLYGYIDNKFTMVIDPVFEKVTDFYNNGARVRLPGRSSKTINRRGKEQDLCHKPKILGKERGAYNV